MTTVTQFPVLSCPGPVRQVADDYNDIVGEHYQAFTAILCGFVFGIGNLSNIFRFFFFSPSVSSLDRLLNDDGEIWKKLNRRHRRRLLRLLPKILENPDRYMWAIDDSIIPHSGRNIWGTYYWHDHNTGGTTYGHRLMVVGLVDRSRKVLIPVFWEILHREDKTDPTKTHEKGWEVSIKLLQETLAIGFPKLLVVADSWFAGEEFFAALKELDFKFVIELKSNRTVVGHGRRSLKMRVDEFFKTIFRHKIFYHGKKKWAASAVLMFKDAKHRMRVVAVANKKGLAEEAFAFYATYELAWDAAKLWAASRDRWAIEVQFRELKQLFTLGEVAVRSQNAVETSISVAAIALTMIRLEQLSRVDAKFENQYVQPIPAGAIVRDLQLQSLACSISKLAKIDSKEFESFTKRINPGNFGRKPTESGINHKTGSGGHIYGKTG
jgi:SRSO17 transposase